MKKNILLLLLMLCMTVGHAFAQDTLYVMKNGVVTQKLVVGKDVDRITFKAPQPVQTNMAYVNGQEIVLNSALLYSDGGTTYICLPMPTTSPTSRPVTRATLSSSPCPMPSSAPTSTLRLSTMQRIPSMPTISKAVSLFMAPAMT